MVCRLCALGPSTFAADSTAWGTIVAATTSTLAQPIPANREESADQLEVGATGPAQVGDCDAQGGSGSLGHWDSPFSASDEPRTRANAEGDDRRPSCARPERVHR